MKDRSLVLPILWVALIAGATLFMVWVDFLAPCSALGWMPVQDVPVRCLPRAP